MRRIFVAATVCAAILLLTAPVAATALPRRASADVAHARALRAAHRAGLGFVPLARRLSGGAIVSATFKDASGVAAAGGQAELDVWNSDWTPGYTQAHQTDYQGKVSFTGVPAAAGTGEVFFAPAAAGGDYVYDLHDMSWDDPGGDTLDVQPGYVPVQIFSGGKWGSQFQYAYLDTWTTDAKWSAWTETGRAKSGQPTLTSAYALAGSLDGAAAYFFGNEGVEIPTTGVAITPGGTASTTLTADEANAQRVWISSPRWASGKAGTAVKISLQNFTTGWVNSLIGQDLPTGATKGFGDWTSAGTATQTRSLTIPRTATPGSSYLLWADHENDAARLSLVAPFQVCSLAPNRPFSRPPYDLYFTGRVPTDGHRKRVLLYQRFASAGQPTYAGGFTKANGWSLKRSWRVNADGKFRSDGWLEGRTAWYCLWYAGDSEHWGAWTSVVKVPYYKDTK